MAKSERMIVDMVIVNEPHWLSK